MNQNCEIWNTIHDGDIEEINIVDATNIRLKIEIAYLAERLDGGNSYVWLSLINYTRFEYEFYETAENTILFKEPDQIIGKAPLNPIVLSCDCESDYLRIYCSCGAILTKYERANLSLANGNSLKYETLLTEAEKYWNEFGSNILRRNSS